MILLRHSQEDIGIQKMIVVRKDVQVTNLVFMLRVHVIQMQNVRLRDLITFVPLVVQTETIFLSANILCWQKYMDSIQVYMVSSTFHLIAFLDHLVLNFLCSLLIAYIPGHTCCRRRCTPLTKCDDGVIGCENDEDCNEGLECVGDGAARKCVDINECSDDRFSADTLAYCGMNATCSNTIGSFYCYCNPGKSSWSANVGCQDTNECLESYST